MTVKDQILEYASGCGTFGIEDLLARFGDVCRNTLVCNLSRLVGEGQLVRKSKGRYATRSISSSFDVVIKDQEKAVSGLVSSAMPLVVYCVYNGETLAPLQHHVFHNNATYIEVDRDAVETVFHLCREKGYESYMSPSADMVREYVDLSKSVVIVKPLVTESPLTQKDGLMVPSLEKLLVDVCKDDDFYFLHGAEEAYLLENAKTLYGINESRLRRYAKRRNVDPKNFELQ